MGRIITGFTFNLSDNFIMSVYALDTRGEEHLAALINLSEEPGIEIRKKELDKEIANDLKDTYVYDDFYDLALDELHRLGYKLEGELGI